MEEVVVVVVVGQVGEQVGQVGQAGQVGQVGQAGQGGQANVLQTVVPLQHTTLPNLSCRKIVEVQLLATVLVHIPYIGCFFTLGLPLKVQSTNKLI